MESKLHVFDYDNGEVQRVHLVRLDNWQQLDFLKPAASDRAFECFCKIYRLYLVPSAPWVFGNLVLFRLPSDLKKNFPVSWGSFGRVADPLTAAALMLRRGATVVGQKVRFRDKETADLWQALEQHNSIQIVRGKLPHTTVIPVGDEPGFLTQTLPDAKLKVNSSFFIMDPFDNATPYDHIGAHFGLLVKDGVVENPPLFFREALLVDKDGFVRVEIPKIQNLRVRIGDRVFTHGENADFFTRPENAVVLKKGLVIIGRRVAAVCDHITRVPGSGFVLCPRDDFDIQPGDLVTYEGMEDLAFGIQVGNSIVKNGEKTQGFISKFFNVRGISRTAFPPSLYPLDYDNARAGRIALGADAQGHPMILWAEGAAKLGHVPGQDSCGASLKDMARICQELGMVNAVNLDGGGSAQLLVEGKRYLQISDRNDDDFSESERPVPMGLVIR